MHLLPCPPVPGGKLSEDAARRYFRQMIKGLQYIHSHGIYHCNLKVLYCEAVHSYDLAMCSGVMHLFLSLFVTSTFSCKICFWIRMAILRYPISVRLTSNLLARLALNNIYREHLVT